LENAKIAKSPHSWEKTNWSLEKMVKINGKSPELALGAVYGSKATWSVRTT
jgi:hypothetical protein